MENLKRRAATLVSVKSIVTIVLTIVFAVLALRGDITGQDFLTIFLIVISFYFGTQSQKLQDAVSGTAVEPANVVEGLAVLDMPETEEASKNGDV